MTNIFRIFFIIILAAAADFVLWRRWREEYSDEEIFSFSIFTGLGAVLGGMLARFLQTGKPAWGVTGWGVMIAGFGTIIWWSRRKKWDLWETVDSLTPLIAWLWALTALMEGIAPAIFAWLGLAVVAVIRRGYRHWRWYKSGKMGLMFLGLLGWFGVSQIAVAFLTPSGIYWGGLEAGQWVSAYLLAFVIVAGYIRSGRKIKEDLRCLKITKSTVTNKK